MRKKRNPAIESVGTKLATDILGGIGFGIGAGITERYIMRKGKKNPCRSRAKTKKNIFVWNRGKKKTRKSNPCRSPKARKNIFVWNNPSDGTRKQLMAVASQVGLYVATWSPGDGSTLYRFFTKPTSYFESDGIYTALGLKDAWCFARGYAAKSLKKTSQNPRRTRVSRARSVRERVASPKKFVNGSLRTVGRGPTKRTITRRKPVRRKIAANPCCGNPRHKHSSKNPLLQTVLLANGKPRRKSKRRVVAKKTRRRVAVGNPLRPPWKDGQRVPIEKARAWVNKHGSPELKRQFAQAEKLQAKANRKATYIKWKILPIGSRTKIDAISAMVHYGQSPETLYKPPKNSKKGKHFYKHDWGDGSGKSKPLSVLTTADGRAMILPLRKGQTIDDWMRG